jgi:hypothetical protein
LTDRWRNDPQEAAIDLQGDGNLYSFYYRSELALHAHPDGTGRVIRCSNLRAGCPALFPRGADGYRGGYSYLDARRR